MHLPFMSGYASGIVWSYHTSDGTVKLPSFSYQQSTAASSVVKFKILLPWHNICILTKWSGSQFTVTKTTLTKKVLNPPEILPSYHGFRLYPINECEVTLFPLTYQLTLSQILSRITCAWVHDCKSEQVIAYLSTVNCCVKSWTSQSLSQT